MRGNYLNITLVTSVLPQGNYATSHLRGSVKKGGINSYLLLRQDFCQFIQRK